MEYLATIQWGLTTSQSSGLVVKPRWIVARYFNAYNRVRQSSLLCYLWLKRMNIQFSFTDQKCLKRCFLKRIPKQWLPILHHIRQRFSRVNIEVIELHHYKCRNQINILEYFIYFVSKNVKLFFRMLKTFLICFIET